MTPPPDLFESQGQTAAMLELFTEKSRQIRVYHLRRPRADGEPPSSDRLVLAFAVLIVDLLLIHAAFVLDRWEPGESRLTFACRAATFLAIAGYFGYWTASQYFQLVFCGRTRSVYKSYILFQRRLARFEDLGDIRLRLEESGGVLNGFYVGVWRGAPYRKPLVLSPRGRSVNQLSHYRHSIIPKVRIMIWGEDPEEALADAATQAVSNAAGSVPDQAGAAVRMVKKRQKKGGADFAAPKPYRSSRWLDVWLEWPLGVAVLVLAAVVVTEGGSGLREFNRLWPSNLAILVLRLAVYPLGCWAAWRLLLGAARRNVTFEIDPAARLFRFRTLFGLENHTYTFNSLIEITVKYHHGRQSLCLVLEGQRTDPVVHIANNRAATRDAVNQICEAMGLEPRYWVDILCPVRRHSASYQRRIMQAFNPYYER